MRALLLLPFVLCSLMLNAQNNIPRQQIFQSFDRNLNWVEMQPEQAASATDFFNIYFKQYNLQSPQDMQLQKSRYG